VATLLPSANNPSGRPMGAPGSLIGLPCWPMSSVGVTSTSLRDWLGDRWAILFSHPDDFASYDLEMDRWLVITRQAFAERRIQPIALDSPALDPQHCWVTRVSGDNRAVLLEDPTQQHLDGSIDSQALVLREAIDGMSQRFALIIDNTLHIQKVFTYSVPSKLPSPLELLGWADALRARQGPPTPRIARHCPQAGRSRIMRATCKVPVRDLIGTRCKTAAAPATVTGK